MSQQIAARPFAPFSSTYGEGTPANSMRECGLCAVRCYPVRHPLWQQL